MSDSVRDCRLTINFGVKKGLEVFQVATNRIAITAELHLHTIKCAQICVPQMSAWTRKPVKL